MKFSEKIKAVFIKLGLVDKAKEGNVTAAEWKAISEAYKAEYGTEFSADQAAESAAVAATQAERVQAERVAADNAAALAIVNAALGEETPEDAPDADSSNPPANSATPASPVVAGAGSDNQLTNAVQSLVSRMGAFMGTVLPDNSVNVSGKKLNLNGPGQSDAYFCGIPHSMFAMDSRWNRIALNPAVEQTEPVNEKKDGKLFRTALEEFSQKVSARINFHKANNTLNPKALTSGLDVTLTGNAGLGDQYVTLRIDQLIARLMMVQDVYQIFPRRFGVQDREVMTNAFFGDFSQAYQEGHVYKGSVDLMPEVGYVDDVMMKTLFKSMKWLERAYIGYLNKENSDPIKWSMIEWTMLSISIKLMLEQNERKILGIYIKPESTVPGHFLNAGTGVYYTLMRYYNENKIALMSDAAYSSYDSGSTMVALVNAMALELSSKVDGFDSKFMCVLNGNHRAMWKAGIREIYGKDTDFTGPNGDMIPDTTISISWCPYFKKMPIVLFTEPGNIQALELAPGEMHAVSFDSEMENVRVWSTWKEGTSATYAGKPFKTKAECAANDFAEQLIFMNKPSVKLAVDATTVTASGDMRMYITSANTAAKAITDIVGAKFGVAYMIEVGSATHPQSIAKSDKFSEITAAYTPTTVGDYILVAPKDEARTKFVELERCVGGVRTINKDVQPNVPGGR